MQSYATKMKGRAALAIAALAIAITIGLLSGIAGVGASASKSKAIDANGDVTSGVATQDITKATVEKNGSVFEFTMKLADHIPDPIPPDHQWNFVLDTDPAVCQEWLFCDPDDYLVGVQSDPATGDYVGFVIHLTNPPPFSISLVPFEVDGKRIRMFVDEGLIGDPSSLKWYANTRPQPFPVPTTDEAPDGANNGTVVWEDGDVVVWTGND